MANTSSSDQSSVVDNVPHVTSRPPPPLFSVILKVTVWQTGNAQKQLHLLTVPITDRFATISLLEAKVTASVLKDLTPTDGGEFKVCNFDLFWCQTRCRSEQQVDYFLPKLQPLIFHADVTYVTPSTGASFIVPVVTLTKRFIYVKVTANDKIYNLKQKIQQPEGIHPSDQILMLCGKNLDDGLNLKHYHITEGSVLELGIRCFGSNLGVVSFADVSDSSNMQKRAWAKTGPAWRGAKPGLCVEGYCCEPTCLANGRLVICNQGMGFFDLVIDAKRVACPICCTQVKPETCAFNKCEWRYTGVKAEKSFGTVDSLGWLLAEDQYERFRSEGANKVGWNRLLITTREPEQKSFNTECPICLEDIESPPNKEESADPALLTQCGHKYHMSCLQAWKKMGKITCLLCVCNL